MKKVVLFFALSVFALGASAQFNGSNCHQVKDSTCRVRIVTLSTPQPWQPIPVPFTVEQEGCHFVYYSEQRGTYCDMLTLIEDKIKGTPYTDARVSITRKPCNQ
jgi:hypothetical protein